MFTSLSVCTFSVPTISSYSWDSSVGIATSYELDSQEIGVRFPAEARDFFFEVSRPVLRPSRPPMQWVPGVVSLGVERPGRESDYSPPSNAEMRTGGAIPPVPHTSSWYVA
jgi:hypothetical protein